MWIILFDVIYRKSKNFYSADEIVKKYHFCKFSAVQTTCKVKNLVRTCLQYHIPYRFPFLSAFSLLPPQRTTECRWKWGYALQVSFLSPFDRQCDAMRWCSRFSSFSSIYVSWFSRWFAAVGLRFCCPPPGKKWAVWGERRGERWEMFCEPKVGFRCHRLGPRRWRRGRRRRQRNGFRFRSGRCVRGARHWRSKKRPPLTGKRCGTTRWNDELAFRCRCLSFGMYVNCLFPVEGIGRMRYSNGFGMEWLGFFILSVSVE